MKRCNATLPSDSILTSVSRLSNNIKNAKNYKASLWTVNILLTLFSAYTPDVVELFTAACADYDPACSGYGVNGYCDGQAIGFSDDYLMKMCKKSCGFCKT